MFGFVAAWLVYRLMLFVGSLFAFVVLHVLLFVVNSVGALLVSCLMGVCG